MSTLCSEKLWKKLFNLLITTNENCFDKKKIILHSRKQRKRLKSTENSIHRSLKLYPVHKSKIHQHRFYIDNTRYNAVKFYLGENEKLG